MRSSRWDFRRFQRYFGSICSRKTAQSCYSVVRGYGSSRWHDWSVISAISPCLGIFYGESRSFILSGDHQSCMFSQVRCQHQGFPSNPGFSGAQTQVWPNSVYLPLQIYNVGCTPITNFCLSIQERSQEKEQRLIYLLFIQKKSENFDYTERDSIYILYLVFHRGLNKTVITKANWESGTNLKYISV